MNSALVNTKVLVTGAGGGVGISIIKASKLAQFHVLAVDMNRLSAGLMLADNAYLIPAATASNYESALIELCNRKNVAAVIPGCDPELIALSKLKPSIESATDAKVIVGTVDAISIGRSKFQTQKFLMANGFNYCETKRGDEYIGTCDFEFPVIVKPDDGSGSVNLFKVQDSLELIHCLRYLEKRGVTPIIQELLKPDNQEYTTGVMFGAEKQFLGSITLKRQLKKGSSYKAWSEDFPEVKHEMEKIGKALDTAGPLNLQCRMTSRGPVVFEINPRFSGTTAVRAWLGFNDVKMVVNNFLYGAIPESTDYRKGVCMVRYLNELYISEDERVQLERGYTETCL